MKFDMLNIWLAALCFVSLVFFVPQANWPDHARMRQAKIATVLGVMYFVLAIVMICLNLVWRNPWELVVLWVGFMVGYGLSVKLNHDSYLYYKELVRSKAD